MGNREATLQAEVVRFVRKAAPDLFVHAVPNDFLRTRSEAAKLKWTGTVAGVPDLCVAMPGGRSAYLEVKVPGGRLSPEQEDVIARLQAMGVPVAVVRNVEEVRQALTAWGVRLDG